MRMSGKKKKLFIIIPIVIILLIFIIYFIIDTFFVVHITLKKGRFYTINYNTEYKEPGYKATLSGKDISDKIVTRGKVNSKKLGNYKITYTSKKGLFQKDVIRSVYVRDTSKPKITLDGVLEDIIVCPGSEYKKDNYKATDNYDGDITKKVKVISKKDMVTFKVTDTSGNLTEITKNIKYEDSTPPKLELKGDNNITIYTGSNYNEAGYSAVDNCDGDISDNVKVINNVNTASPGSYEIVYEVVDKAGNKSDAKRSVKVINKPVGGTIYLTFDDGPQEGTTNVILNILKEEGVKATFFVTNKGPDYLIKREYDEGHTVALHTATHDYSYIYSSPDNYFQDLETVHTRVLNITGYDSKFIRFPGGSSNTVSRRYYNGIMSYLTKEVQNRGYKYYDWNISSGDAGSTTDPNGVYANVVNNLSRSRANMVLMHDIKTYTRDAVRNIVRYGKENGYTFAAIDEGTPMVTQRVNN